MKAGMKMDLTKRYWIATASQDRCRHADALHEIGFINWVMGDKFHFKVGDVVYLFMKDERRVRFQLEVIDENCKREDQEYWIETAPNLQNILHLYLRVIILCCLTFQNALFCMLT